MNITTFSIADDNCHKVLQMLEWSFNCFLHYLLTERNLYHKECLRCQFSKSIGQLKLVFLPQRKIIKCPKNHHLPQLLPLRLASFFVVVKLLINDLSTCQPHVKKKTKQTSYRLIWTSCHWKDFPKQNTKLVLL